MEMREPAGTALTKCTVQLVTELGERVVLEHWREERATEAERAMVAEAEEPLSDAERIAVWSVENMPVVTGKVKDAALAGTVMDAGIWSAGLLVERAMTVPAAGAGT
jgi:hypothetical protein